MDRPVESAKSNTRLIASKTVMPRTLRKTEQRAAIRRALEELGRPAAPLEIQEAASAYVPGLGIATVYRTVRAMVERGILLPVELPGAPNRYELAGKDHHHHFHCTRCDRVYEVDDCPGRIADLTPAGFSLQSHELTLYGHCAECEAVG